MSAPAPPRSRRRPVTEGPRWYRSRIRALGHWVALVIPGVVGLIGMAALRLSDAAWSGAVGLVAGVVAAPGLLVVGAPFSDDSLYPWGILGSAVLWLLVGMVAARRATRDPFADWSDYWRHYLLILGGIWIGALTALAIAAATVGEPLI